MSTERRYHRNDWQLRERSYQFTGKIRRDLDSKLTLGKASGGGEGMLKI